MVRERNILWNLHGNYEQTCNTIVFRLAATTSEGVNRMSILINEIIKRTRLCFVCDYNATQNKVFKLEFKSGDTLSSMFLCDKHLSVLHEEIERQKLKG